MIHVCTGPPESVQVVSHRHHPWARSRHTGPVAHTVAWDPCKGTAAEPVDSGPGVVQCPCYCPWVGLVVAAVPPETLSPPSLPLQVESPCWSPLPHLLGNPSRHRLPASGKRKHCGRLLEL